MRNRAERENTARRAWFPHPPAAADPDRWRHRRADVLRDAAGGAAAGPAALSPARAATYTALLGALNADPAYALAARAELTAGFAERYAADETLRRYADAVLDAIESAPRHRHVLVAPTCGSSRRAVELGRATEAGCAHPREPRVRAAGGHPHHRLHDLSHEHLPAQVHRHRADGRGHTQPVRGQRLPQPAGSSRGGRQLRSTTSWLRLLADWPSIQRVADQPPGFGDGAASLAALDAQVDAARADGMEIVLVPYRYPRWSNGTDNLPPDRPECEHRAWDRHARLSQYLDFIAGNRPPHTWKPLEYGLPLDGFKPGSRWATYVEWVWDRYAGEVGAFEVVNEPNLQIWPQRTTIETDDWTARWGSEGTTLSITPAVADMMVTMDAIARRRPDGPPLLAPVHLGQRRRHGSAPYDHLAHASARAVGRPVHGVAARATRATRFQGRRPLDLVHPQLRRRRTQAAPRRLPAPGLGPRRLERAPPGRRPGGLEHRRRVPPRLDQHALRQFGTAPDPRSAP